MEFVKKLKLRSLPNYQWIYLIVVLLFLPLLRFSYDNDFWFTINQGRYILNNGFPHFAINSIHDINCIYQSWGSCTLFYLIYHYLGNVGMIVLMLLIGLLTVFFFYKLCYVISNNKKRSLVITLFFTLFYDLYFVTRPHLFTILNLVIMLYLIESYLKTNKVKYLFFLPLISLFQINMHGIYFIVLLVILIPYLINSFKLNIFGIFKSEGYQKKYIFLTYFIMLLTGLLNPYGIKTIIYGFKSYDSSGLFNNTIIELRALDFHDMLGKIFIITIIFTYIIYFYQKRKLPLRYYLFLFGTTYLAFDAVKSFYFFFICSFFPLAYIYQKNNELLIDKPYSSKYHYFHLGLTLLSIGLVIYNIPIPSYPKISKYIDYLDKHVQNKEEIKVYSNFADGSYLEYRGYYCYMDPRAEIFLKSNNHKEDLYKEYDDLQRLKIDYRDFLKKYQFDYMLIDKEDILYYFFNKVSLEGYEIEMKDANYMLVKLVNEEG